MVVVAVGRVCARSVVRIDSAAFPFVGIAAVPFALSAAGGWWGLAVLLSGLPIAIALFFRDPPRTSPGDERLVLAPADGRVMHAGPARGGEAPPGDWLQVTVFLSVLDVHINRTPVAGRVRRVLHVPGTFLAAFKAESAGNEHSEVWVEAPSAVVVFRQVVGLLARRVVCRVKVGDVLTPGQRVGLMKFGSRMDVFVPVDATLAVATGGRVRAGETVIARLAAGEQS
jgi:phosphatidylserine decarboxylase